MGNEIKGDGIFSCFLSDINSELLVKRRSPLSVCVCVQSCQFSHFVAKMKDFVAKTKDFWWRQRIFYFFFVFAKNPSSLPHCLQCLHCIVMREAPTLSMCRHTNEGILSTEHVQMLHWACAYIVMRGNPLTDMTENTEDANTNWQCLHAFWWKNIMSFWYFTVV